MSAHLSQGLRREVPRHRFLKPWSTGLPQILVYLWTDSPSCELTYTFPINYFLVWFSQVSQLIYSSSLIGRVPDK